MSHRCNTAWPAAWPALRYLARTTRHRSHPMKPLLPALAVALSTCTAAAQAQPAPRSPWGVGVAAVVSDSPYAGEGARVIPVPVLSYESPRLYVRGLTAGWRIGQNLPVTVELLANVRLDGIDADDLGRRELAANGVQRDLLTDRDHGLDLGAGLTWRGNAGEVQLQLLGDVSGRSRGQEASLQYGYPLRLGRTLVTPLLGARWHSSQLANYYYGTLPEEVARGVVDYRPGASVLPQAGVSVFHPLGRHWSLVGSVRHTRLPDAYRNSPLLERGSSGTTSAFIGLTRGFQPWWLPRD